MSGPLVRLPARPEVEVLGTGEIAGTFPVGRILCVGRNYGAHAREMGHDPDRDAPFFFMKPASALTCSRQVVYPSRTGNLHHEVELVVAVARAGINLTAAQALDCVLGYGVGLDLTRRDLQDDLKARRRPWEAAKVFPGAAVCGTLQSLPGAEPDAVATITLLRNGVPVQCGRLEQMIWGVADLLSEASQLFGLEAGDLVYTGTPAGVGSLQPGDGLRAEITGLPVLECRVVSH